MVKSVTGQLEYQPTRVRPILILALCESEIP